jgi:hypothetical protein
MQALTASAVQSKFTSTASPPLLSGGELSLGLAPLEGASENRNAK